MRNVRHPWQSLPVEVGLFALMIWANAPTVAALWGLNPTPKAILSLIPGLSMTLLIAVFWRPIVAYSRAMRRARLEAGVAKAMTDRAVQLRDLMLQQQAAAVTATDAGQKARATREFQSTITELEELVAAIQAKRPTLGDILSEIDTLSEDLPHRRALGWARRSLVTGLTGLAVSLAGVRGARLRDTWMADLAGAPEEGLVLSRWQQVGHAMGFVVAAVRMRGHVLSEPLWRPVDWLLSSESRTRTTTTLAVGGQVIYIAQEDGLHALLTEGWGWCGGCALALHLFFRWLRKVRGIELAMADRNSNEV